MKTRAEHLLWCKDRALEYVEHGDLNAALASFTSDMNKHEDTSTALRNDVGVTLIQLGVIAATSGNKQEMRNWINGFN